MPELNYSLWLIPEGELQTTLAALIDSIAQQYSAPAFPAHITLLGNVHGSEQEILASTQKLAQSNVAFPITLTELDTTPEFYRALFIRVALSSTLAHLYEQGKQIFQFNPKTEYRPHLSLLYSDLSREQKDHIIASIQSQLHHLPHTFTANTLHLYNTDGAIETWHQIAEFPLKLQTD
jgi:hypothetical protein